METKVRTKLPKTFSDTTMQWTVLERSGGIVLLSGKPISGGRKRWSVAPVTVNQYLDEVCLVNDNLYQNTSGNKQFVDSRFDETKMKEHFQRCLSYKEVRKLEREHEKQAVIDLKNANELLEKGLFGKEYNLYFDYFIAVRIL